MSLNIIFTGLFIRSLFLSQFFFFFEALTTISRYSFPAQVLYFWEKRDNHNAWWKLIFALNKNHNPRWEARWVVRWKILCFVSVHRIWPVAASIVLAHQNDNLLFFLISQYSYQSVTVIIPLFDHNIHTNYVPVSCRWKWVQMVNSEEMHRKKPLFTISYSV